ncbi:MAG: peptidase [Gemmatimonadetes bacterium]|nr:peptidase [Gemmatimonadota bacterium]
MVVNGTTLPSSISSADCFSTYGDPNGRPTSSYYADLHRVTLTAGQTITVTMDSGDNLDTYLLLAGPTSGRLVAGNDDDDTGVLGVGSRMTYTATVSGVYVIEASTFNGLDTGNYTLGISIH